MMNTISYIDNYSEEGRYIPSATVEDLAGCTWDLETDKKEFNYTESKIRFSGNFYNLGLIQFDMVCNVQPVHSFQQKRPICST